MLFTDTVTIFNKKEIDGSATWDRVLVAGVQWSDKYEKDNASGKISIARYAVITFPEGKYEGLTLCPENEEDVIFFGDIQEIPVDVRGYRISDLMKKYPRSGRIKTVNDNSNRTRLKHIRVVIG